MATAAAVLGFELEWADPVSGLVRVMLLKFYTEDNTIEIISVNNGLKSMFLKRIFNPDVQLGDLFIGHSISVFNRVLIVKKSANDFTERYIESHHERFLCTASSPSALTTLLIAGPENKLHFGRVRTNQSGLFVLEFVTTHGSNVGSFLAATSTTSTSGLVVQKASFDEISSYIDSVQSTSVSGFCSLCLLKPHAIRSGNYGEIVSAIAEANFVIKGVFSVHLSPDIAEEFLTAYKNIYTPFSNMVEHICSAPVLAIMISGGRSVVEEFREFTGPLNPEVALALRPKSLRAQFGVNLIKNGVHCTDLSEDGEMECRFFFEYLANL